MTRSVSLTTVCLRLLACAFMALTIASCAEPASPDDVSIAPSVYFKLPNHAALGKRIDVAQLVSVSVMGQTFSFETRLLIDHGDLLLIATDPAGRRALTIRRSHQGQIEVERADWVPAIVNASNILADIMLIYFPHRIIGPSFQTPVTVEDKARKRTISRDGQLLISIDYAKPGWQGQATLINHIRGYAITVRSVEVRT